MQNSSARRLVARVAWLTGLAQTGSAAEILIGDEKSQPESLIVAPGGTLFVGTAGTPFVYKVGPGSATAEKFVDACAEGAGAFLLRPACRYCYQNALDVPVNNSSRRDKVGAASHRSAGL